MVKEKQTQPQTEKQCQICGFYLYYCNFIEHNLWHKKEITNEINLREIWINTLRKIWINKNVKLLCCRCKTLIDYLFSNKLEMEKAITFVKNLDKNLDSYNIEKNDNVLKIRILTNLKELQLVKLPKIIVLDESQKDLLLFSKNKEVF